MCLSAIRAHADDTDPRTSQCFNFLNVSVKRGGAPNDAGEVEHFLQGLSRAADFEGWSLEERQELRRALTEGSMDSLVTITSVWWGSPDVDRTKAWFLARCGDGGMGVTERLRRCAYYPTVPSGPLKAVLGRCRSVGAPPPDSWNL